MRKTTLHVVKWHDQGRERELHFITAQLAKEMRDDLILRGKMGVHLEIIEKDEL